METVRVSLGGWVIGVVRYDPVADRFSHDPGVPALVVSDITVTYYRENVLFGRNGDGYAWAEVTDPKR